MSDVGQFFALALEALKRDAPLVSVGVLAIGFAYSAFRWSVRTIMVLIEKLDQQAQANVRLVERMTSTMQANAAAIEANTAVLREMKEDRRVERIVDGNRHR
jgi:hypothetical protein